MSKEALIKARVTQATKDDLARIAAKRGESEAVIVREAIKGYILREDARTPADVDLTKAKPVRYAASSKQRRKIA